MNKILSKTVNKETLMSIVMATLLVLSIVLTAIFGVSYAATLRNANTLTVTVNQSFYNKRLDDVKSVCDAEFNKQGLTVEYSEESLVGADGEVIYYFASGADVKAKVETAKGKLAEMFAAKTDETNGEWKEDLAEISVSAAQEDMQVQMPVWYALRALIAVVVFAALAFAYAAIRHGLISGITTGVSALCGAFLSAAVVLLTRMPITNSALYIFGISAIATSVFAMLTMNKLRAKKDEQTTADLVVESTAVKEICTFSVVFGVALILVGAVATWSTRWFAIAALVSLVVTVFVGLIYVPALYWLLKKRSDKKAFDNAQYGKQRAEKQERKAAKKAAETVVVEEQQTDEE